MTQNKLKIKPRETHIYGILLESDQSIFLSVHQAYSLEEAFVLSKNEFALVNPDIQPTNLKIGLFTIKSQKNFDDEQLEIAKMVNQPPRPTKVVKKLKTVFAMSPKEKGHLLNQRKPKISPQEQKALLIKKKNELMETIKASKQLKVLTANAKYLTKAEYQYLKRYCK